MNHTSYLLLAAATLAAPLHAEVIRLYDSFVSQTDVGFSYIKTGTDSGTSWGAMITPFNPMPGHPAGFRIWSYSNQNYSRADATHVLGYGLTGGFRVSFKAVNQNYFWIASGLRKIALRAGNPSLDGLTINSSSANYQNLLEVITDGTVAGAWNRVNETGTAQSRYVTDPGGGTETPVALSPHLFDLIINASVTETYTYVLHGIQRTLDPLRMDLFIDGVLATPAANPNGTIFENKSGFNTALGFGTFSFTTATASHEETDFVMDQIYIYTGDDVSEGEVAANPMDRLLADSATVGDGYVLNPLIGLIYVQAGTAWFNSRGNWAWLYAADDVGYWVYDATHDEWVFLPHAAPGWVYVYNTQMWDTTE
jgi:hypothetical protein